MKSAYELAMERLDKTGPMVELDSAQRAELADIDERFRAKVAEKEVFLGGLIDQAKAQRNFHEVAELEEQRGREITRLRENCEQEKEAVRNRAS